MLVTTGVNRLVSADPGLAQNVLTRRMAFLHPDISTQAMGFAGGNVITVRFILRLYRLDMGFTDVLSRRREIRGRDSGEL